MLMMSDSVMSSLANPPSHGPPVARLNGAEGKQRDTNAARLRSDCRRLHLHSKEAATEIIASANQ